MSKTELRRDDLQKCLKCGQGVAHGGQIQFFRIAIESWLLNLRNIQSQHGLELQIGNPLIAQVMGPDAPLANRVSTTELVTLCSRCFMEPGCVASLWEQIGELQSEKDDE